MAHRHSPDVVQTSFVLPVGPTVAAEACIEEAQFLGGILVETLDEDEDVVPGYLAGEVRWKRARVEVRVEIDGVEDGTAVQVTALTGAADASLVLDVMREHLAGEVLAPRCESSWDRLDPLPGRPRPRYHIPSLAPPPRRIFISYRRSDTDALTGRIADRLSAHFGSDHIFKDIDSIPFGRSFPESIVRAIHDSDVVLAIIGPTWLAASMDEQPGIRRVDEPGDFVRIEIETALDCGTTVMPVLVRGAALPSESTLPPSLTPLAGLPPVRVRPDPDFHPDIDRLILQLRA